MVSMVLFIKEKPVGYAVTVGKNSCYFIPVEHKEEDLQAPSFEVLFDDKDWQFDPFFDWRLRNQILENMPLAAIKENIPADASAAP